MGRGNSLVFGKIALHSETATMKELVETLDAIMKSRGYPEARVVLPSIDDLAKEEDEEDGVVVEDDDDGVGDDDGVAKGPWDIR